MEREKNRGGRCLSRGSSNTPSRVCGISRAPFPLAESECSAQSVSSLERLLVSRARSNVHAIQVKIREGKIRERGEERRRREINTAGGIRGVINGVKVC